MSLTEYSISDIVILTPIPPSCGNFWGTKVSHALLGNNIKKNRISIPVGYQFQPIGCQPHNFSEWRIILRLGLKQRFLTNFHLIYEGGNRPTRHHNFSEYCMVLHKSKTEALNYVDNFCYPIWSRQSTYVIIFWVISCYISLKHTSAYIIHTFVPAAVWFASSCQKCVHGGKTSLAFSFKH